MQSNRIDLINTRKDLTVLCVLVQSLVIQDEVRSSQRVCPPRTLTGVGPPRDQGQEGGRDLSAPEVLGSTNTEILMLQKL